METGNDWQAVTTPDTLVHHKSSSTTPIASPEQIARENEYTIKGQNSLNIGLIGMFAFSLVSVILLPRMDVGIFHGNKPGLFTYVSVGLVLSLLTYWFLTFALRGRWAVSRNVFLFTMLYSVCVIAAKFSIGAASLFKADPLLINDLSSQTSNVFNGNLILISVMAIGVFILYYAAFKLIANWGLARIEKVLGKYLTKTAKDARTIHQSVVARILIVILIGGFLLYSGGWLLLLVFFYGVGNLQVVPDYLSFVFSTGLAFGVALALVAAAGFLRKAVKEVGEQAIVLKTVRYYTSFVWVLLALLAIYHALWIVYLLTLTTLWPLRSMTIGTAPK